LNQRNLGGLIADYITHLKVDQRLSFNTVSLYVASVAHFYSMNDVSLNWKKLSKFKGKKRSVIEDKPYTKEQIRQLLDFSDLRGKCIILLMCSAGLRRGALPRLRIRDLEKIQKYGLYKISVYEKEEEGYVTTNHLDQYFEWRAVQGERLTDTTPVIRRGFSSLNVARPKAISEHAIDWFINNLLDKSCIRPKTQNKLNRTEIMQCHGFRKYFETTSKLAGMDSLLIDRCMGHKTRLKDSYTKLNDDQILEGNDRMIGYIGAIDNLTINEENRLRIKVDELTQKQDEIQLMRANHEHEMKAIHDQMTQIMSMVQQNPKLAHVKPEALVTKRTN
jgi:integrase